MATHPWESVGIRAVSRLLAGRPELRERLVADPKGTVLYTLPTLLRTEHADLTDSRQQAYLTDDDQLWLVGVAEAPDAGALLDDLAGHA